MSESIQNLCSTIIRARKVGQTTCKIIEQIPVSGRSKPIVEIADDFVESFGFFRLNEKWIKIDVVGAQNTMIIILSRDMAHQSKAMTSERAKNLAEQFLALFEDARFFTNGKFNKDGLSSWDSITGSTFDAGVVCVSPTAIGILWAEDED